MLEILTTYGVCFGLMNDKFPFIPYLRRIRIVDAGLSCAFCAGFHSGYLVRLAFLAGGEEVFGSSVVVDMVSWGFAGAAACYLLDTAARAAESLVGEGGD